MLLSLSSKRWLGQNVPGAEVDAGKRFRERLAYFRRQRNWTLADLAEEMGLAREVVAAWEQGRAIRVDVSRLVALADALNVSLDELCGRTVRASSQRADAEKVSSLDDPGRSA
jgi:transcriptional regulator with XRE-family HTH domain